MAARCELALGCSTRWAASPAVAHQGEVRARQWMHADAIRLLLLRVNRPQQARSDRPTAMELIHLHPIDFQLSSAKSLVSLSSLELALVQFHPSQTSSLTAEARKLWHRRRKAVPRTRRREEEGRARPPNSRSRRPTIINMSEKVAATSSPARRATAEGLVVARRRLDVGGRARSLSTVLTIIVTGTLLLRRLNRVVTTTRKRSWRRRCRRRARLRLIRRARSDRGRSAPNVR